MRRLGRLLMAGCLFLAAAGSAQAQQACSLIQITNTNVTSGARGHTNYQPSMNATGTRIAFVSTLELLGNNGPHNAEIFLWDAATGLSQISQFNNVYTGLPSINAAGNRISFSSTGNFQGGNGDGNGELFLWDATTGLTQITNTVSSNSFVWSTIDATGNRIAFDSMDNFVGSNGDRNSEIFLWDAATGFTQLTNTVGGFSDLPVISASGNRITFQSDPLPTAGTGPFNQEIFLWDAATGLTQITHTPTNYDEAFPTIDASGNRIAFTSKANFTGGNVDGNTELFLWDSSTGFTQLTNTLTDNESFFFFSAMNAAGDRIVFRSNADPLGTNHDGNHEIFLWDASSGLTQITDTSDPHSSGTPTINAEGDRITFDSTADLVGSNGDESDEIFLATCPRGAPAPAADSIPAVSPLGLGILAALLGLAAAWTLRRRRA